VRSGFVAVAGRPNVGKSTLVNALCGAKVAIVSDKPQTTRRRIHGVANGPDYQLVLVDLPGFQRPLDTLTERMQRTVDGAFEDVDGVLLVIAANERIGGGDRFVAARAFGAGVPVVVALNKVDRVPKGDVPARLLEVASLGDFRELHPVSARTGEGVDELRESLVGLLSDGPAYFPEDELTDLSVDDRIAELVREQALARVREEVPHALTVEITDLEDGHVRGVVYVETESQKGIVVGKGGTMIKAIGSGARPAIEDLLGRHVYLELQVKVRPKWRKDAGLLERLGI
jgi:GTP-binding protein Era